MARRFFRKYMPHPDRIKGIPFMGVLGHRLHQPNLWHLNRRSVARAIGVGIFWALIPMPFQSIPSAVSAVRLSANLGLAIAMVWLTNPLTMPIICFGQWALGQWVTGQSIADPEGNLALRADSWTTPKAILLTIKQMGASFVIGALLSAAIVGPLSYLGVDRLWRWNARRRWRARGHPAPSRP